MKKTLLLGATELLILLAALIVAFTVMLLSGILDPHFADAVECDPSLTCDTAQRTPNFGFPKMVPRMCHPEDCYNETITIVDDVLCTTTTTL